MTPGLLLFVPVEGVVPFNLANLLAWLAGLSIDLSSSREQKSKETDLSRLEYLLNSAEALSVCSWIYNYRLLNGRVR